MVGLTQNSKPPSKGLYFQLRAVAPSGYDPSPARIPSECREGPTKGPFSGGAVGGGACAGSGQRRKNASSNKEQREEKKITQHKLVSINN